jgi:uncharacterized protein YijF (DUF1287 family)
VAALANRRIQTERRECRNREWPASLVVHNLGSGAKLEDVLFAWRIIGHCRYFPAQE